MENNSTLEKILWVFNRNAELLRLVGATFYSKVASLRRTMKKNFIILKSLLMAIFCFICFVFVYIWVVKYQLKVFGTYLYAHWTYSLQSCIWNFSQYYNNLHFYYAIINWNFIWNIVLNSGIYWDLRNKSVCLNTVLVEKILIRKKDRVASRANLLVSILVFSRELYLFCVSYKCWVIHT